MRFAELDEALENINATDECDRYIVFDVVYSFLTRKGMLCFDAQGKALGMKGDDIIRRALDYHTYELPFPERCWWLHRYLLLYEERFYGIIRDVNQPGPLEFSTPQPKRNYNYADMMD